MLLLASVFFVLSGVAALVYQVAWQRLLTLTTGVYSVALITAAFMAGLGIGSHVGGALFARLSPRRALLVLAAIESAVAVFATTSVPVCYACSSAVAPPSTKGSSAPRLRTSSPSWRPPRSWACRFP